jgi:hypothetical protein
MTGGAEQSVAAWRVGEQEVFVAGAAVAAWALPRQPATVVCLRRRAPETGDYPLQWRRHGLTVVHHPLSYWCTRTAVDALRSGVDAVRAAVHPVVSHCALGLDRAGLLALAVLISSGLTLTRSLELYRTRGVRLPDAEAMAVLHVFARETWQGQQPR